MNSFAARDGRLIVLKEEQVLFGGLSLYYRFTVEESLSGEPRFGVAVDLGKEQAKGDLGNNLPRAWDRYLRIVNGAVTPCSLSDVLADFTVVG